VQALHDHDTVINVIDAVVAGTKVSRSHWNEARDGAEATLGGNTSHARAPVTGNVQSPSENLHVAGNMTLVLEVKCSLC